jgi:hypothetical protein
MTVVGRWPTLRSYLEWRLWKKQGHARKSGVLLCIARAYFAYPRQRPRRPKFSTMAERLSGHPGLCAWLQRWQRKAPPERGQVGNDS